MTSGGASWTIEHLRSELIETLEEDVDTVLDKMKSLHLISLEENIAIQHDENSRVRVEKLMDLILLKGETACENFLSHIESIVLRFPALPNLFESFVKYKEKVFQQLVEQLDVKTHLTTKLSLSDVLSIGPENVNVLPQQFKDIMCHFLRKLMALNQTARNIELQPDPSTQEPNDEDDDNYEDVFEDCTVYFNRKF
ncbi:unnamed protein product [Ranitomeya imitator]|uniref:CARD domain-containing protein n=1 Tax=Ranitomeya imitator TaxID=111125 RepID=A0ABN9MLA0_9NEOB|nr:unnamed protein product [Ranitomeya imitator]